MSSSIQEFGAPLGWTPKSLITWNQHFLPYALRWDDMRFDLGRGEEPDFSVVELNLITGETRQWGSFAEADEFYGLKVGGIGERMRKNFLIDDRKFFYVRSRPPSDEKLKRLKQAAEIACSFSTSFVGRE